MSKLLLILLLLLLPVCSYAQHYLTSAEIAEVESLLSSNQQDLNELITIQRTQLNLLDEQRARLTTLQATLTQAQDELLKARERLTISQSELQNIKSSLLKAQTELKELRSEITELQRLYEKRDREASRWKTATFTSSGIGLVLLLIILL